MVALRIWTQAHNADKTAWAMESLKASMRWDEERYGLEYDLDLFNIVAVDDFNMGAMENKSLNIFNSRLVLASPATATDDDYAAVEGVIGHEVRRAAGAGGCKEALRLRRIQLTRCVLPLPFSSFSCKSSSTTGRATA